MGRHQVGAAPNTIHHSAHDQMTTINDHIANIHAAINHRHRCAIGDQHFGVAMTCQIGAENYAVHCVQTDFVRGGAGIERTRDRSL